MHWAFELNFLDFCDLRVKKNARNIKRAEENSSAVVSFKWVFVGNETLILQKEIESKAKVLGSIAVFYCFHFIPNWILEITVLHLEWCSILKKANGTYPNGISRFWNGFFFLWKQQNTSTEMREAKTIKIRNENVRKRLRDDVLCVLLVFSASASICVVGVHKSLIKYATCLCFCAAAPFEYKSKTNFRYAESIYGHKIHGGYTTQKPSQTHAM